MAKKKQSKQMMTMAMAAVLAFSTLPVTAYAEDGTSGVLGNAQKLPAGVKPAPSVISPAPGGLGGITPSAPETTPGAPETTPGAPETTPGAPETTPGAPETTPGAPTPSIPGLGGGMPQLKPGFGGETLPEGLKPAPEGVEKAPEGLKPEEGTLPEVPNTSSGSSSKRTPSVVQRMAEKYGIDLDAKLKNVDLSRFKRSEEIINAAREAKLKGMVEEAPYEIIMSAKELGLVPAEQSEALKNFLEEIKVLPSLEELEANAENEEYMQAFMETIRELYEQYKALSPYDRTEVPADVVTMLNYAELMVLVDGYEWDAETKTLTLTNYTGSVEKLPDGATIVVNGENIVTEEGKDAIKCDGALSIKGDGKLVAKGQNGVTASSVSIEGITVGFEGTTHGINVYNDEKDATVTLKNVKGNIEGAVAGIYVECDAEGYAGTCEILNGCDLTLKGKTGINAGSKQAYSGVFVYSNTAAVDCKINIEDSKVAAYGSSSGLFVNSHSNAADTSAEASIVIDNSQVIAETNTTYWAGLFLNNFAPAADCHLTVKDSYVASLAPNDVGIMATADNGGTCSMDFINSTVGVSGRAAGIRIGGTGTNESVNFKNSALIVADEIASNYSGAVHFRNNAEAKATKDAKSKLIKVKMDEETNTPFGSITFDASEPYYAIAQGSVVTETFGDNKEKVYTFNNQAGGVGGFTYADSQIWGFDGEVIPGTTALKTAEWIEGDLYEITVKVPGKDPDDKHDEIIMMVDGSYSMDNEWPAMKEAINTIGETVLNGSGNTQLTLMAFGMADNEVLVHAKDANGLANALGKLPGNLLYGRSSTNCEAGFTGVAEYIEDHDSTLNDAHVIFISDGNLNTDETPRAFDANWQTWTKLGAVFVAQAAFEETLTYGEELPEAFKTVFGDRFDGATNEEILKRAFGDGEVADEEFLAFAEQLWTDVYEYSNLKRGEEIPVSDAERAFVKYDKENDTYIQDLFYYTTYKSAYVNYNDRWTRTPKAADALAAMGKVKSMYVVDYDSYTSWMDTGITSEKSTFVQSNGIAGLCEALSGALTNLAKTPFNDVVVTDYMSEWVNLDPSTICVVDNSTGEVIWNATEGWKITEGRPTNAEAPVKVELVNPADYAAGGADVVGNKNGNIYKLTWNVKDGAMLRSDTYSLKYKVTVDRGEDDFVPDTDYPANGETVLHYKDENGKEKHEGVKVPEVGTGNSYDEPEEDDPEIEIDNDDDDDRKPAVKKPEVEEIEEEKVPLEEMPEIVIDEEEVPLEEMPGVTIPAEDDGMVLGAEEEKPMVLGEEEVIAGTSDSNHAVAGFGGMLVALAGMFMLRKKKEN